MKIILFSIILFLYSILASDDSYIPDSILLSNKCNNSIEHCLECNPLVDPNFCSKCQDTYFWLPDTKSCIPCNDTTYGQIGCGGNCDGSDYSKTRFAFCESRGCIDGYSNLNGLCIECNISSLGCSKCAYEVTENAYKGNFICNECESNEYKLTEYGNCEHCSLPNCKKCHFNSDNIQECDECREYYYKSKNGECKYFNYVNINGGYCYVYSDNLTDYNKGTCWCHDGFTKISHSKCLRCPDNCKECNFNNVTNNFICLKCNDYYTLNKDKKCIYCGNDCKYCIFDEKYNSTTCLLCSSGISISDNNCKNSISGCEYHTLDKFSENKNESICKFCDYWSALNLENKCTSCSVAEGTGEGKCKNCKYDEDKKKYKCFRCFNNNYVYINNTFQCFSNMKENNKQFYGCLRANFNEETNNYECYECKENFILINNYKICVNIKNINLSLDCVEYENKGTIENPEYSCNKCKNNSAFITNDNSGKNDCFIRSGNLSYCLKGNIDEKGNYICLQCVDHASLNNYNICECSYNYFGKFNEFCYKCDDENKANPGCLAEKGCNYIHSNDQLDCNECKEGYFEYTRGQCFPCKYEISNCGKCHFNYTDKELKCDNCLGIYTLDEKNNKCILNDCKEYPNISPGCIICKDKLNEYKPYNKCQYCKYGYFKTKDDTCIYCRSEKYGGPSCYECGYEEDKNGIETDNIICKTCFSINNYFIFFKLFYNIHDDDYYYNYYNNYIYHSHDYFDTALLSSNGKCYGNEKGSSKRCLKYELDKDNTNINKLKCTICSIGYYLDSNGNCISYTDKLEKIPNCDSYKFNIIDIHLFDMYFYPNGEEKIDAHFAFDRKDYSDIFNLLNEKVNNLKSQVKTICLYCKTGYYVNDEGKCEILDVEKCTGRFVIQNIDRRMSNCYSLCYQKGFLDIHIKIKDNLIDYDFEDFKNISNSDDLWYIGRILRDFIMITDYETQLFILNSPICYIYPDEIAKAKFEGCEEVIYIPKTKSFHCLRCINNFYEKYVMDNTTNICEKMNIISYCNYENLGTRLSPIYSCKSCNYEFQVLITYKNGIKDCVYNNDDYLLKNCLEANDISEYINPIYNCTSCRSNYKPIYSEFYQRVICVDSFEEINKINSFTLDKFNEEESISTNNEGNCEKNYFTPDGKNCYNCDNKNVGMPGCKGECSFSTDRYNMISCESECKEGYIESSKGICKTCNLINEGCKQCHYENDYPIDYIGIKKSRRFQCDYCDEGYLLTKEGKCITCQYLFWRCEECEKDKITKDYKCIKCSSRDYAPNENGYCSECIVNKASINNKCIDCGDIDQGGIKNCILCENNEEGNKIICKECNEDYINFINNNTCLNRRNNRELENFDSCLELKFENGKLICSRCKHQFSLFKINDNDSKCTYTPTLYDVNFKKYYYFHYYHDLFNQNSDSFYHYIKNDYDYKMNYYFPCKESINLGTEENPLYSCTQCYNVFNNTIYDRYYYNNFMYDITGYNFNHDYNYINKFIEGYYEYFPVKIIDITKNNIIYCTLMNEDTKYCIEATYEISKGKEIYSCTKCMEGYNLYYSKRLKFNYCSTFDRYNEFDLCLVDDCKSCISNNEYFCSSCISSDYEINKFTGACIKKSEVIPSVTWKDIYRLNMNGQKEINGQEIEGPSFKLRGITSSEINTRHAFLIYLSFKIRYDLINPKETIHMPAICEIDNEVNKTDYDINIVDYECIGNNTIEDKYELAGIEDGNNDEIIINADLEKLNNIISDAVNSGKDLSNKTESDFTDSKDIFIFMLENNEKIKIPIIIYLILV